MRLLILVLAFITVSAHATDPSPQCVAARAQFDQWKNINGFGHVNWTWPAKTAEAKPADQEPCLWMGYFSPQILAFIDVRTAQGLYSDREIVNGQEFPITQDTITPLPDECFHAATQPECESAANKLKQENLAGRVDILQRGQNSCEIRAWFKNASAMRAWVVRHKFNVMEIRDSGCLAEVHVFMRQEAI